MPNSALIKLFFKNAEFLRNYLFKMQKIKKSITYPWMPKIFRNYANSHSLEV
jgi:hypothetical protein